MDTDGMSRRRRHGSQRPLTPPQRTHAVAKPLMEVAIWANPRGERTNEQRGGRARRRRCIAGGMPVGIPPRVALVHALAYTPQIHSWPSGLDAVDGRREALLILHSPPSVGTKRAKHLHTPWFPQVIAAASS